MPITANPREDQNVMACRRGRERRRCKRPRSCCQHKSVRELIGRLQCAPSRRTCRQVRRVTTGFAESSLPIDICGLYCETSPTPRVSSGHGDWHTSTWRAGQINLGSVTRFFLQTSTGSICRCATSRGFREGASRSPAEVLYHL